MPDTLTLLGPIDLTRLAAPFPPEAISWRVGATNGEKTKGLALAYIDARDVMDRLDEVCGLTGWQCEYVPMPNGTTCCRIGIMLAGQWVWKSNGAGATGDVNKETEREMAEKGGYSDALKRAAVVWGVGRYLYSLPSIWVAIESRGKSYVIKDSEYGRLRNAASIPGARSPAPDSAGGASISPSAQSHPQKVLNPETGKMVDPNCANQLRKPGGAWDSFKDKLQGFEDAGNLAGLKAWFASDEVNTRLAAWPDSWRDNAQTEFDRACDRIQKAERAR